MQVDIRKTPEYGERLAAQIRDTGERVAGILRVSGAVPNAIVTIAAEVSKQVAEILGGTAGMIVGTASAAKQAYQSQAKPQKYPPPRTT